MLGQNIFGADLGSDTIKIYSQKRDRILSERNMIAVKGKDRVIAVGDRAYEMYGKNPPGVDVRSPISDGMIADYVRAAFVVKKMLKKAGSGGLLAPVIYFSVPMDITRIEMRAYYDMSFGIDRRPPVIHLVEQPICDALAIGVPMQKAHGSMIVNIGAQSTMISVVSGSQIVISKRLPYGGARIDDSLCDIIRRNENLIIGPKTAEALKTRFADCERSPGSGYAYGMDVLSGGPRKAEIPAAMVHDAVMVQMNAIADEIRNFIERIPPQTSDTIRGEGYYLTGGCSAILHISEFLSRETGVRANLVSDGRYTTIRGLREMINHKPLRRMADTVRKKNEKTKIR